MCVDTPWHNTLTEMGVQLDILHTHIHIYGCRWVFNWTSAEQLNIIYIYGWMDALGCVHTPDGFSTEIWMDRYTRVWHQMGVSTEQHIYGWIHSCVHTSDEFSTEQHTYDTWMNRFRCVHTPDGCSTEQYTYMDEYTCVHTPDEIGFSTEQHTYVNGCTRGVFNWTSYVYGWIHVCVHTPDEMGILTEQRAYMDGYTRVCTHRWDGFSTEQPVYMDSSLVCVHTRWDGFSTEQRMYMNGYTCVYTHQVRWVFN